MDLLPMSESHRHSERSEESAVRRARSFASLRMTLFPLILAIAACAVASSDRVTAAESVAHPEWSRNAVLYEVNVRQFTPEGTFKAMQKHLPRLDSLGVDILWMMPVQPIGKKNRKGSLGSYYSIANYTSTNPEFGTAADFKALVDAAHGLGLKVILDWVPNHTA